MPRATAEQIMQFYVTASGHPVTQTNPASISGSPGHYYALTGAATDQQLIRATYAGSPPPREIVLLRVNDLYLVYVGGPGSANVHFPPQQLPPPGNGQIEQFQWVAHTHPLDNRSRDASMAEGPTQADYNALCTAFQRFRQTESRVIVCQSGHLVAVVPFTVHGAHSCFSGGPPVTSDAAFE
jgi:hypothetical protein